MGFNDINLQVSGPQQPASIYKTKVLKGQVPFATQVTDPNTKYVIKHNFVLNGDVTIPENCILEFDGGSISGEHTITGQNTGIEAGLVKIFSTDVNLVGTWKVAQTMSKWFGAIGDGVTDDTIALQKFVNVGTNLLLNSGTYKITDTIRIPACKSLDGSWAIINIEKENIVGLLYEGIDTDHYNIDTVLHNIRIRSSYDGVIAIKFGEGVYFNYLYDFDIAITGENAIGIVETNNFNVIVRDGRIIGNLPYKNGSIGILLTTNSQSSFNAQVTNILVDSVLIQRFDKCIKLDYGTTANDTIMFSNIGFSSSNLGYYITGFTSATIVNQRMEGSNKLLTIINARDISIRDIYLWNSGFLDMEAGSLIISGYLDAMNSGAAQVADKQFAKITSGLCRQYGRINNWGFGVADEITGSSIIGLNNIQYNSFENCSLGIGGFFMDDNKAPRYKRGQNDNAPLQLLSSPYHSVSLPSTNTTINVSPVASGYKISGKVDSITGGYVGQKISVYSADGKSYYVNVQNEYLRVDKSHSIVLVNDNGTWKYAGGASATPVMLTLPTLDETRKGTMFFDGTNGKPVWWNGTAWVDATGTPV